MDWYVEFKFIPWRGAYAIGLPHLIGGLSAALTGSLRALLDAGFLHGDALTVTGKSLAENTQQVDHALANVGELQDIWNHR